MIKMSYLIHFMSPQRELYASLKIQVWWTVFRRIFGKCLLVFTAHINDPLSAQSAQERDPVTNFADTGPRDSGPPHFKKGCYPAIPPRAWKRWQMLPLCQLTDSRTFRTSCVRELQTTPWNCNDKISDCQSADGALERVLWLVISLHPAKQPARYLPSFLVCWPRMALEHRSAFRASVLLACVIICSNVLCPVGAYLYNNRYVGWVKTPIHFWGSWETGQTGALIHGERVLSKAAAGKAHTWYQKLSADYLHIKRRLSYVERRTKKGFMLADFLSRFGVDSLFES